MPAQAPRQLNLPTAARLVGSLALAGSGVAMYYILLEVYPDEASTEYRLGRNFELFVGWFSVVGILVGWRMLGTMASGYPGSGITLGCRAALTMSIWVCLGMAAKYSAQKMAQNAYGSNYTAAILDWVNQSLYYFGYLIDPVAGTSAVGLGVLSGLITVWAARQWR